ncbi:hypothetical protein CEY15_04550 [Dietzia natronolimnaea]|uniref:Uncharacterized protein n=1 Tax=Dietzia natronolimnaea TaxID=161920 RepID=A0A2A2WTF3_9ACTN|nr:hypothetical protein [Dietzia natronolimnaea]PAY24264.1 hypothetical protein CEY15_04550 [Dietzia natronolimnaea]
MNEHGELIEPGGANGDRAYRRAKDKTEAERKREIDELNRRILERQRRLGRAVRRSQVETLIVVAVMMYLVLAWLFISPVIEAFWPW